MPSRTSSGAPWARVLLTAVLAAVLVGAAGCLHAGEAGPIPPLPSAEGRVNPGLGPDARPLSTGPGDKGSPSWSPAGDRVAFIVDGYVVDRPAEGGGVRRWTTRDFMARDVAWSGEGALSVLGGTGTGQSSLYRATPDESSFQLREAASGVLAVGPGPEEGATIAAFRTAPGESGLALLRDGEVQRVYAGTIAGTVTGLSLSPDGRRACVAVRLPGSARASEVRTFGLADARVEGAARLGAGIEVLGAPEWTDHGIYFVAGSGSSYDLYRAGYRTGYRAGPDAPETGSSPAPGVGEDFVAGGISASPDGETLAVVGRLNPKSPPNLYLLDPRRESFEAVTTNEDMEIKAGPGDLAWSPGGASVAIVARGDYTEEPEVRANAAENLLDDFYNLYEIPVGAPEGRAGPPGQR